MTDEITVRLSVEGQDAENVWVSVRTLQGHESIPDAISWVSERMLENLSRDALSLYASRVRYGKGLIR